MNRIILAYERFDKETGRGWNFNGRLTPSDISVIPDQLDAFNEGVYRLLIEPQNNLDIEDTSRLFINSDMKTTAIKQMLVSEITDELYFYPIEIRSAWLFLEYTSHLAISEKVLNDIKNNRAFLLLVYESEGDLARKVDKLNTLITQLHLPKDNVVVMQGDFEMNNFADQPYIYKPINVFPWWLANFKNRFDTPIEYSPKKLFLSYNRRPRPHRLLLIDSLRKYGLLDFGLVSLGPVHRAEIDTRDFARELSVDAVDFLCSFSGTSIDNKDLAVENPAVDIDPQAYIETFVSLVTETLVSDNIDFKFFSEKTYKPIVTGHPFLLLGGVNQLGKLREFGFKTFGDWWDESYDTLPTTHDRILAIAHILAQLNNKTTEELLEIRKQMIPILKHNQEVFGSMITVNPDWSRQPIRNALEEIIKSNDY